MTHINSFLSTSFVFISIVFASVSAYAQDSYVLTTDFLITIEGTSNVHDWDETANNAAGAAKITPNTDGSFTIQSLVVTIDAKSLKSSKGSTMDNKTYEALKTDANPTISFRLSAPILNMKIGATGNASGILTIAGVSKPISLLVKVSGSNEQLTFEGTKVINMKDFGVSPPTAFMGAMKVGETVTLKFKSSFGKK